MFFGRLGSSSFCGLFGGKDIGEHFLGSIDNGKICGRILMIHFGLLNLNWFVITLLSFITEIWGSFGCVIFALPTFGLIFYYIYIYIK